MNDDSRTRRLERDVRLLKGYAVVSSVLLILLVAAAFVTEGAYFQELEVERLNVRNADGGLALVLAGQGRLPGPTMGGREYPQEYSGGRVQSAGMIFFNERGDEVGGLIFHGDTTADGYTATGHLSFDQFRQDQVIALQYIDGGTSRRAGLNIWDRSTEVSIGELLELLAARDTAGGAQRDSLERALNDLAAGGGGAHRIFLGSQDRDALLLLRDPAGRPRVRLGVDSTGSARLEFLDSAGTVVRSYPE